MNDNFGPQKQVFLLAISILFLILYIIKPFKKEKLNDLCLAFSIFTASWLLTLIFRYLYRTSGGTYKTKGTLIEIPYGLKCFFGQNGCENGDFEIFSVFHIIGYFTIGLFVPNCYWEILILSIACEFIELEMGYTSKFFLDPAINIAAYAIGSAISWNE
jgi:hypothetical protein